MLRLQFLREERWTLPVLILAIGGLAWLMLYHLGSLSGGLSAGEQQAATALYGWHGLYRQPFYLPLDLVRSVIFVIFGHHGQIFIRLPNALFGALTIISFTILLRAWYGGRTAALAAVLFACSAWTLHVSRLASNDILYLWALPALLLTQLAIQRYGSQALVYYGSALAWLLLLYVPGLVWLVAISIFWARQGWLQAWQRYHQWWQRGLYILWAVPFAVCLVHGLTDSANLKLWLGLPQHWATPLTLAKQFAGVPYHLLLHGPLLPAVWLERVPVLDIFSLTVTLFGLYVYVRHWRAGRSQLLLSLLVISWLLVSFGGPVSLSILLPPLYLCAAAGIAYLLREWLRVFPRNPLARVLGLGLMVLAVTLSAGYNIRAYFVAWAHDPATRITFRYRR